ncbi:MAG: radical SAM protein [Candidatus Competibacteraceae bacterium]|nr:radical SAM protein [Candidatus Competibacteraceae bacterium]MCB1769939.1 radical SAM protein [Candidatus Competibacteraceae bacterium]MCB1820127.1 radical SAM protein [Candidatus Competibacteraceae bacterium]
MPSTMIALNKAHYPVTALGPGRRIGLWLQGCTLACPGCVSQDTWTFTADQELPLPLLMAWCQEMAQNGLEGITLSGGEPFAQPAALRTLLQALHDWREDAGLNFDILCYSGLPWSRLQKEFAPILILLDALIPEPFQAHQPTRLIWRGSANQPLIPLSPRGEERYAPYRSFEVERRPFQIVVDAERMWGIGIPGPGDLARLEQHCAERGVQLGDVSWRG